MIQNDLNWVETFFSFNTIILKQYVSNTKKKMSMAPQYKQTNQSFGTGSVEGQGTRLKKQTIQSWYSNIMQIGIVPLKYPFGVSNSIILL